MKTNMRFAALGNLTALTLLLVASATAHGGLTVVETNTDKGSLTTYKLTVTPAPEPVPALKHRLMLRDIELQPGNAAPYYYRALLSLRWAEKAAEDKFGDDLYKWYTPAVSLDELPLEKVREAVRLWTDPLMSNLRTATGRRKCDWQWDYTDIRGPEAISFILEDIQESRGIARGLMLRARLAIAEGRLDDALECLRLNYRLATDVTKEPLLVCDLVGMHFAGMGNCTMIELIAQPNSPNLYWALSELPRPLISTRGSIRVEVSMGLRTFPFLMQAETAEHSPEEWARLLSETVTEFQLAATQMHQFPGNGWPASRIAVAGLSLIVYPAAKQRLIDGGLDLRRVEQMAVGQVLAIDAAREYRRIADEYEKWQYIPYRVVRERNPDEPLGRRGPAAFVKGGYGYVLASMLLPAITAARTAEQRILWQMEGIRTVEAIRMHAARTGALPKALDEIKVVPVPNNPATAKPFEYELDGDTAVLELPRSDGFPGQAWRFEITLAESSK